MFCPYTFCRIIPYVIFDVLSVYVLSLEAFCVIPFVIIRSVIIHFVVRRSVVIRSVVRRFVIEPWEIPWGCGDEGQGTLIQCLTENTLSPTMCT
jgi:hypothetical protein